jgi:hypothetical protein
VCRMIVENQFDCSADPVDGIKKLKEFQRMDLAGEQSRAPRCAALHRRRAADRPDHRPPGHRPPPDLQFRLDKKVTASCLRVGQDRGDICDGGHRFKAFL